MAVGIMLAVPVVTGRAEEKVVNHPEVRVVRQAFGGGRWFPGREAALRPAIEGYFSGASIPVVTGRIVAAIAPHAGYVYSGPVAGYTFRAIRENAATNGSPDVVVVLGFSHREAFRGLALMDGDALATPLGEVALDRAAGEKMVKASDVIRFLYDPHRGEHSAENEVPFIQVALPGTPVVVGLFGDHDEASLKGVVAALGALAKGKRILVVASTDLLHDPDYDKVKKTDAETLKNLTAMDDAALIRGWSPRNQICCGLMPVLAAVRFAREQGADGGRLLRYRNSGDDHPESRGEWVVGYGAVVYPVARRESGEKK